VQAVRWLAQRKASVSAVMAWQCRLRCRRLAADHRRTARLGPPPLQAFPWRTHQGPGRQHPHPAQASV